MSAYLKLFPFLGYFLFGVHGYSQKLAFRSHLLFKDNNEACVIGDVNQDGMLDIVAGRNWYPAPDFVPRPLRSLKTIPPDYAQNNGEYLWDVDGDGWLDVLSTGWGDPYIRWYRNPGLTALKKGLPWEEQNLIDTQTQGIEAAYFEDLNGDSIPEYIINSYNPRSPFTIYRFLENGTPKMERILIGPHNSHGVGFGDVNGDGRKDILIDRGWYEQPSSGEWLKPWDFHADWNLGKGSCPFQVMDVNLDGRNDIIHGMGHDYGLQWLEQNRPIGDSTTWTSHAIDRDWSQIHAMLMVDVNGDGQQNLITGKRIYAHSGKDPGAEDHPAIYAYSWDTTTSKFHRTPLTAGAIGTGLFIRAADLNGDEKPDLVVAGKTGTYILWQE